MKIAICDDHLLFCQGLGELIKKEIPGCLIFIANTTSELEELIHSVGIEVLICDINLNGSNGLDWMLSKPELLAPIRVIVITGYYDEYTRRKVAKAPINAFLKKEAVKEELIAAILGLNAPQKFTEDPSETNGVKLSKQEKVIVKLVAEGLMSKEIASRLSISKSTVDTHRRNINKKLGVTGTAELLKVVYEGSIFL